MILHMFNICPGAFPPKRKFLKCVPGVAGRGRAGLHEAGATLEQLVTGAPDEAEAGRVRESRLVVKVGENVV
jgi:hypothetical protein